MGQTKIRSSKKSQKEDQQDKYHCNKLRLRAIKQTTAYIPVFILSIGTNFRRITTIVLSNTF